MTRNLCIGWTFSPRSMTWVMFHVELWAVLLSPWVHRPPDPLQKEKGGWKFMCSDFPFGPNVAISNMTTLQVEYSGNRIHCDRIHNKACSIKSIFTLSPSMWASQIDSFSIWSYFTFMLTIADTKIWDNNKMLRPNALLASYHIPWRLSLAQ